MLPFPHIDPVAITIGPLQVRWYGLMYMIGFLAAWGLARHRAAKPGSGWTPAEVDDMLTYGVIGVVLGGRIGYVLFYNLPFFLSEPAEIFKLWHGGMSFHGGLLGVVAAMALFGRRTGKPFLCVTDFVAPLVAPGLLAGRLGNFINAELWGRTTFAPWGMVFPGAGPLPRHPSQLYEAGLEGVILFLVLWQYSDAKQPRGRVSGMFLLLYGLFRFWIEFYREPDPQVGFVLLHWMSMGQLLSLPLMITGLLLLFLKEKK
jgi:phosphatidylglycerol:prolipoprotein diacylglycerol transferase